MKYRTIVADPPWPQGRTGLSFEDSCAGVQTHDVPYETMSVDAIAALPLKRLSYADVGGPDRKPRKTAGLPSHEGSNLFLWTTQRFLCDSFDVAKSWGFRASCVLVWCKPSRGFGMGGLFQSNTEFVLYARRGAPYAASRRIPTQWFMWPRGLHSAKPEAFYDLVEEISPGPYLELFARRQRLGWDTWGNEALNHVELESA